MDTHRYCASCGIHSMSCPCVPVWASDYPAVCAHKDHAPSLTVSAEQAKALVRGWTTRPVVAVANSLQTVSDEQVEAGSSATGLVTV